jgi:integrase-like protein
MTEKKQKRRGHGEGTLYQRANGRWTSEISLENGMRKTLYAKTRKEAAEKLNQALQEQRQGTLVTAPQQTLETHMNQWLHMKRRQLKGGTFAYYRYNVECHINSHLGQVKLQKLAPEQIQGFYTELLEELSPNTVRIIHTLLKAALDVAVKWKKIASNPCLSVTPPRAEKKDIQYLTLEQAKRLIEVAKHHWMIAALMPVAIATGMRRGELLALTWGMSILSKRPSPSRNPSPMMIEMEPKKVPPGNAEDSNQQAHHFPARLCCRGIACPLRRTTEQAPCRALLGASRTGVYEFVRGILLVLVQDPDRPVERYLSRGRFTSHAVSWAQA